MKLNGSQGPRRASGADYGASLFFLLLTLGLVALAAVQGC